MVRCCPARRDDLHSLGNSSPQGVLNIAKSAGSRWRGFRRTLIGLDRYPREDRRDRQIDEQPGFEPKHVEKAWRGMV
jgi:hypothetical protein